MTPSLQVSIIPSAAAELLTTQGSVELSLVAHTDYHGQSPPVPYRDTGTLVTTPQTESVSMTALPTGTSEAPVEVMAAELAAAAGEDHDSGTRLPIPASKKTVVCV